MQEKQITIEDIKNAIPSYKESKAVARNLRKNAKCVQAETLFKNAVRLHGTFVVQEIRLDEEGVINIAMHIIMSGRNQEIFAAADQKVVNAHGITEIFSSMCMAARLFSRVTQFGKIKVEVICDDIFMSFTCSKNFLLGVSKRLRKAIENKDGAALKDLIVKWVDATEMSTQSSEVDCKL